MTSKVAFFASRFARDAGVVPVQRYHCSVDLLRLFEFAQVFHEFAFLLTLSLELHMQGVHERVGCGAQVLRAVLHQRLYLTAREAALLIGGLLGHCNTEKRVGQQLLEFDRRTYLADSC